MLQIDAKNDLVEVETYLKEEGILVTNWFPISFLKKPADTKRRGLKLETQVHTNLVKNLALLQGPILQIHRFPMISVEFSVGI